MSPKSERDLIAIVGPCASGKSSLARELKQRGLRARQVVQEHSYVPDMWQVISKPGFLVYLDASFEACAQRKKLNWQPADHAEQARRLEHARDHCDFYLLTDELSESAVVEAVLEELRRRSLLPT